MEELPNEIIERVIVCLDLGELLPLRVSQSLPASQEDARFSSLNEAREAPLTSRK